MAIYRAVYDSTRPTWNNRDSAYIPAFTLHTTQAADDVLVRHSDYDSQEAAQIAAEALMKSGHAFAGYIFQFVDACYPTYVSAGPVA